MKAAVIKMSPNLLQHETFSPFKFSLKFAVWAFKQNKDCNILLGKMKYICMHI